MLTKWFEKWFCEIPGHLWCLLDELRRVLMCSGEVLHLFGRLLAGMHPWSPGAVRRGNPWAPGAVRRALVRSDAFSWV